MTDDVSLQRQIKAGTDARNLVSSDGWKAMEAWINERIEALRNDLERDEAATMEDVKLIRGQIKALRQVLGRPQVVIRAGDIAHKKLHG